MLSLCKNVNWWIMHISDFTFALFQSRQCAFFWQPVLDQFMIDWLNMTNTNKCTVHWVLLIYKFFDKLKKLTSLWSLGNRSRTALSQETRGKQWCSSSLQQTDTPWSPVHSQVISPDLFMLILYAIPMNDCWNAFCSSD